MYLSHPRWNEIDAAFARALDLEGNARSLYLTELERTDGEIHGAVVRLLTASAESTHFLEGPCRAVGETLLGELAGEGAMLLPGLEGTRLGAFRIVEEVGRGGSGSVYLAERADGSFRQRVAVKVLRRGLDTEDTLRRFAAERQILASLEHGNIARVFDGGVTEDGRPWFVMEYVEGEPITSWCDRRGLSLEERLQLFLVVAEAVQHAHRKLVVHRDLKPSNILVTEEGTPKLLDFGIAKLLEPAFEMGEAPATRAEVRLMTPGYATPEQIRGGGISTATDVYLLGILLYELLCGNHPHLPEDGDRTALERRISEEEPLPPSERVRRMPEGARAAVAGARSTGSRRLGAALRGDLDTIVLKALEKEQERRYPSVDAMAADLRSHLGGHPIRARSAHWTYRAGRFIRRNPVPVGAAALLALTLAGYAATASAYAERLGTERDRARIEAENAERMNRFLTDLFQVSAAGDERGDTLSARTLLDRGAARLAEARDEEPELRARMLEVVGGVYLQIGVYGEAEDALRESLRLRTDLHGEAHPDVATTLRLLSQVLRQQGNLDDAEEPARRALEIKRESLGPAHPRTGGAANTLALLMHQRGDYPAAEALYGEALEVERGSPEPDEERLSILLNNLGAVIRDQGRLEEALPYLEEAVDVRERVHGPDHLRTAVSLSNLGLVLQRLGRLHEAEAAHYRSLEIRRRQLDEDNPAIAVGMNNVASLRRALGDYEGSEALHREAIAFRERVLGPGHPNVGTSYYNLGQTLRTAGRYGEAEPMFRRGLEIWRAALGPRHPNVATGMGGLAENLRSMARADEAAVLLEEALEVRRAASEGPSEAVARVLVTLALTKRDLGSFDAARDHAREAVEIRREVLGEGHLEYGVALLTLGSILLEGDAPLEAEPLLRESLGVFEGLGSVGDPYRMAVDARLALARSLLLLGRHEEALEKARTGLTMIDRGPDGGHAGHRTALELMVAIHEALALPEGAEPFRQRLQALGVDDR